MEETWKDILGYEGNYQISNLGRLRTPDKLINHRGCKMKKYARVLKTRKNNVPYEYAVFSVDKKRKTLKIHRLVAQAFIPNPENKPAVNHINGNKHDNRVDNLEWVTSSENTKHAVKTGLKVGKRGAESHLAKINQDTVNKIRSVYKNNGLSQNQVSQLYGISQTQVYRIVNYLNWR